MYAMRLSRLTARSPVTAAFGAAAAITVLLASPGTARAEDDGRTFEQGIIHNILTGIGLQDPNATQPTYEQRPPLVIPKGDNLPPPQKPGAVIANNPAWPRDPDVLRAKALAKREKNRDVEAEMLRENDPLPPDQLGPRGAGARQASAGIPDSGHIQGRTNILSPSELGYKGGLFSNMFGDGKEEETAAFSGEPARTSLTQPPAGYRTPSPDQPYGVNTASGPPKADKNYTSRGTADKDQ